MVEIYLMSSCEAELAPTGCSQAEQNRAPSDYSVEKYIIFINCFYSEAVP